MYKDFLKKRPDYHLNWSRKKYSIEENRIKRRILHNKWSNEIKKKDPSFKIIKAHYSRVNQLIGNPKSFKTMKLLGCSKKTFINYLSKKFKKGMTFENYGIVWHVDHIIPLGRFHDLKNNKSEQKIAFNYKNMRPWPVDWNLRRKKPIKSKYPITRFI